MLAGSVRDICFAVDGDGHMATCKFCRSEIQWRRQGFKWIAEKNGQPHRCVTLPAAVIEERRREEMNRKADAFLYRRRGGKN